MNLTWHIVKKDVRALVWPIAIWLLCIVARLGIGVMLLTADGGEGADWFGKMDVLTKVLGGFQFITFVLTAAVIQQDLLVGTTSFWMTRPISGGRLLRAKLITLCLVFLLLPVLVNLPWWLGCGYGVDEIAWAAGETLAVQAIAVLLGLLWSVVTDGFGRFLMWTLVTVFAAPMLVAIISFAVSRRAPPVFQEIIGTRFLLCAFIAVIGIAVVTIHQFLTRRTERSIGIIAATVGGFVLTGAFWPWSWNVDTRFYSYLIHRAEGEWPAAAEPAGLKFTPVQAEFSGRRDQPNRAGVFASKFRVDGLTDGQGLIPVWSEHIWRWPDGTEATGRTWGHSGLGDFMKARVLGIADPDASVTSDTITFSGGIQAATMEKIRAQAPAYSLQARFRLMRFVSAELVPMMAGKWTQSGTAGERIAGVEKEGPQMLVTFVGHRPSLWIDNIGGGPLAATGDYVQYYLVNRAAKFLDRGSNTNTLSTRIGTVSIYWRTTAYRAVQERGSSLIAAINALNEAELAKVTFAEQARFSHSLALSAQEVAEAKP
jgi:hypothetical protein